MLQDVMQILILHFGLLQKTYIFFLTKVDKSKPLAEEGESRGATPAPLCSGSGHVWTEGCEGAEQTLELM